MNYYEELKKHAGNKCAICGRKNVLLVAHHIVPLSKGGTNKPENLKFICPDCHARIHYKIEIREFEFVDYLFQVLQRSEEFRNVRTQVPFGKEPALIVDLVTEEKVRNRWEKLVIECKAQSSFTINRLKTAIAQINSYRKYIGDAKFVLAFPGELTQEAIILTKHSNIEIWDLSYLAQRFKKEIKQVSHPILQPLFLGKKPTPAVSIEQRLITDLQSCKPGWADRAKYQELVGSILERLFCPPLSSPIPEISDASNTNRRDYILPNYAENGYWSFLRERYSADYIVVDAKNLSSKAKKKEVLQIANYLKPHGVGLFGLIVSRKGGDRGCIQTLREVWAIEKKLIIVLTDTDIEAMLLAKSIGNSPEDIIRQKIEDFRLSI